MDAAKVLGSDPPIYHKVHLAEVANNSRRPIRDISCRIQPEPGDACKGPLRGHVHSLRHAPSPARIDRSEGTHIPILRADVTGAFVFAADNEAHPKAQMTTRFTDDAGLYWQIDHDLHLERLPARDW